MNNQLKNLALAISLILPAAMSVADTTMVFDTITLYKVGIADDRSTISGIEKDSGNNITAHFRGARDTGSSVSSICTPQVLTAMEKSGRYFLHVSWDESTYINRLAFCMLELKPQPN